MATARATITRTASPAGWLWTFDRTDVRDAQIDNFATAESPAAALDAIKPLVQAMPGTLSKLVIMVESI